jgi:hypothetical protein
MQKRYVPSCFFTNRTGDEKAEELDRIMPCFNMSWHWRSSSSFTKCG